MYIPLAGEQELLSKPLKLLMEEAAGLRDAGHGRLQTWSPKVFVPLTQLCRNLCHYCTFSQTPERGRSAYLTRERVVEIARAGKAAGCTEVLFTLGDKPELRFSAAREELKRLGHPSTLSYLAEVAAAVRDETGLLPHINAGVMTREDLAMLRPVAASMGLMVETLSARLCQKGGAHYRSPDKKPDRRIDTIRLAGELAIPFTTGILIGIGETPSERIQALLAIRDMQAEYGHIQEIIIQNFRAKPRTVMAKSREPDLDDLLWTIAAARILLGSEMNIQAPPNLSPEDFGRLIDAGINDWGGISPITLDHVNPEAPWPQVERLQAVTAAAGRVLVPRLPLYPSYYRQATHWLDPAMVGPVMAAVDASGLARDGIWSPGLPLPVQRVSASGAAANPEIVAIVARAAEGVGIGEDDITQLFAAHGPDLEYICTSADSLRRAVNGDAVTYVVNRNINYTNICYYKCGFCAFSKGSTDEGLRGRPYNLDLTEIVRRVREAWDRGGTEVCLQGGIHPHYTGETYVNLVRAVRAAVPEMHIHAFSPLEIWQGAATSGLGVREFLIRLQEAGLDTLPGTAAEVLDDEVRKILCPDKVSTEQWLEVMETAHQLGLRTTATIMFGHVDTPRHWARHLIRIRVLQARTAGFTEFVPLPFVPMEAPIALRGLARRGPTFREVRLMHAVARLALHPYLTSIQTSWVKLGAAGVQACLTGGANDMGGTLMNESISRAAGTQHGQEMSPLEMEQLIREIGREPRQRTTTYGLISGEIHKRGLGAANLTPVVLTAPRKDGRRTPTETLQHV